jgi:hypothetical protein
MSFDDRYKPCVICESTTFEWGEPTSESGVWFKPDRTVGNELGNRNFGKHGLSARICRNCGNMQLFLKYFPEPEKKKNG